MSDWNHKKSFFFKSVSKVLEECAGLIDERGSQYDTTGDSFIQSPTVFLDAVTRAPAEDKLAIKLAVLCDVKLQRIQTGDAKRDSYLDLINYIAALVERICPGGVHKSDFESSTWGGKGPGADFQKDLHRYVMDKLESNGVGKAFTRSDIPNDQDGPGVQIESSSTSISEFARHNGEYPE